METLKAIAKRKSVRAFAPDQISEEALQTILAAGCAAPVGMGAYDTLHLTVIQNAALLKRISDAANAAYGRTEPTDIFFGAPTAIVISSSPTRRHGSEFANASCVAQNMLLTATDLGLGSIYLMSPTSACQAQPELVQAAGIPDGFFPAATVALGFSAEEPFERTLAVTLSLNRL